MSATPCPYRVSPEWMLFCLLMFVLTLPKRGEARSHMDPIIAGLSPRLRAGLQLTLGKEISCLQMISCECKGWGVVSGGQGASRGLVSLHSAPQMPAPPLPHA